MSVREPIIVTTRRKNVQDSKYYDYDTKSGLDYITEINTYATLVPYLYVDGVGEQLFDNNLYKKYYNLHAAFMDTTNADKSCEVLFRGCEELKEGEELVLYVHGFNNSMETAVMNGKHIANATKRRTIIYDWASTNNSSNPIDIGRYYAKDQETSTLSVRPFTWLLHLLLSKPITLHILCHSMGSRIVVESIKNIAHDYALLKKYDKTYESMLAKLGCILFKQPDIDIVSMVYFWFKEAYHIGEVNENLCIRIFAHDKDKALNTSQLLHLGIMRVGQFNSNTVDDMIRKNIVKDDKLEMIIRSALIDASSFCKDTDTIWSLSPFSNYGFGNHSYFDEPAFQHELGNILDSWKLRKEERNNKRQKIKGTGSSPYSVLNHVLGLE